MNNYKKDRGYVSGILFILLFISSCSQLPTVQQSNSQNIANETKPSCRILNNEKDVKDIQTTENAEEKEQSQDDKCEIL